MVDHGPIKWYWLVLNHHYKILLFYSIGIELLHNRDYCQVRMLIQYFPLVGFDDVVDLKLYCLN